MNSLQVLRMAVLSNAGIFDLDYTSSGEVKVVGGYESKLLEALSQGLKTKFHVVTPDDGEWGRLRRNGNWTGIIGLIVRDEAEMALSWLTITEERLKAVDFSYPYYNEDITFATQKPATLRTMTTFIRPIVGELWIIAALLIVLPFVFRFVLTQKHALPKLFLRVFGLLVRQSFEIQIRQSFRERALFASWMFTAFFMSAAYTAVVLAFMAVPLRETGIQTIEQLHNAVVGTHEYQCAVYRGTMITENLRQSKDERSMRIGKWIFENKRFIDSKADDVIRFIAAGKTALIAPRRRLQDVLHDTGYVSKESFYSGSLAVAIRKDFKMKSKLDDVILRIREAGIYEKSLNDKRFLDYLNYTKFSLSESEEKQKQLSLHDLMGVFIMLFCGLLLALTVFVVEVIGNSLG